MRWVAVLLLFGCGPSGKDVVKKHKAEIEGQAAKLQALVDDVSKRPPVTEDRVQLPSGVKLGFNFAVDKLAEFNAAVVYPGRLKDACKDQDDVYWFEEGRKPGNETQILALPLDSSDYWLADPVCVLTTGKGRSGTEAPGKSTIESALRYLPKVRYVLVPRLKFIRPTYDIDPDGKVTTFHSGSIAGDFLLYDLEGASYLGGFPMEVMNSDEVEDDTSAYQALELDLQQRLKSAVQKKLDPMISPGSYLQ